MSINRILTATNNNLVVGSIFYDLQKVYDSVNHKLLPDKFEFYGIVGKFKTLTKSCLKGDIKK
jgi:hypothetical protein